MPFNEYSLIVEHHLNSLCTNELEGYVAHIICTCGQLDFFFDTRPFSLKKQESMIITVPQLVGRLQFSSDFEATCIYVRSDFLELCTPRSNYGIRGALALYVCPVMQMNEKQFELLKHDFYQIEKRLQDNENHFQKEVLICATQMMFLDFFSIHTLQNGLSNISFQDADIMARFMQMLERGDYIQNREVGYYADKLFVTPKYLSEVCKSVSGKTANYWITRFTTIHIRRLLLQKEKSFTEIADMFEFSSLAYFSRFVQKHLGTSPTNFRA